MLFRSFKLNKTLPEIYDYIDSEFELYSTNTDVTLVEKVWMILNHSTAKTCTEGKQLKFDQWAHGYVYCSSRCKCAVEARQNTMVEKYGSKHALQCKKFKDKFDNTLLEKYGATSLNDVNKGQRTATCMEKYGAPTPLQSKEILEKTVRTNQEKYGCDKPFQRKEIQKLINDKWQEINGTDSYVKSREQILQFRDKVLDEKFGDKSFYLKDPGALSELLRTDTRENVAKFLECSLSLIDKRIKEWDLKEFQVTSYYETLIGQFLTNLGISYIENTRKIISPKELDFYIPSHNLAIEFNGLHWHSELLGKKDSKYHLNKTELCKEKGIRLIHIFQDEWDNNAEIVKSIISNALRKTENKIYARKCTIKELSNSNYADFLNANHLQGLSNGTNLRLGLYYLDELVSAMSFNTTKQGTELSRFVNKINCNVVGAANKLFLHARKNYNLPNLYTYSDRRYFSGKIYKELGFKFDSYTTPSYHYFISANKRYDRTHFMKHKLEKLLDTYDSSLTEFENMKANGYDRIWDCGHTKWIL